MKLTTGYDFQGYFITDYIDVIFDEMLVGIGFGKGIVSSIDNWLSSLSGGEATEIIDKLNDVKEELRKRVILKAEQLGANALIGIDFEGSQLGSQLGSLIMVSMTATAVRIDKILEPLPLTEGKAAQDKLAKEHEEKERLEEENRQQRRKEHQEKVARGEAREIDKEDLLNRLNQMDTVDAMLAEVKFVLQLDETLLTDEQIKELETCKEIARMYGTNTGVSSFRRNIEKFLAD